VPKCVPGTLLARDMVFNSNSSRQRSTMAGGIAGGGSVRHPSFCHIPSKSTEDSAIKAFPPLLCLSKSTMVCYNLRLKRGPKRGPMGWGDAWRQ